MSKPSPDTPPEPLTLMYHGLDPGDARYAGAAPEERAYVVSADVFDRQLDILRDAGREIVAPEAPHGDDPFLAPRQVLLTFDDGLASDFDVAWPRLRERGLGALCFVNTDSVGGKGRATWEQLAEMSAGGVILGAHGRTHAFFSDMSADKQREEMERARQDIKTRTGAEPWALSLPGGRMNRHTPPAAREAGYQALFTSSPDAPYRDEGLWIVGRIPVTSDWGEQVFSAFIENQNERLARMRSRHRLRRFAQAFLGPRLYGFLHRRLWEAK